LHNSLKASRAATLSIPESAQESTTLQRVVLNCPGLCSAVPAASVFTFLHLPTSGTLLARFFLKPWSFHNRCLDHFVSIR
jgi:hypothetical protein